jgi:hypothetical protein
MVLLLILGVAALGAAALVRLVLLLVSSVRVGER